MAIHDPFVLFVGPTKSGTTWIQAYLEARGDIALPEGMKETFFFDKVYEKGFDWYAGLFPPATDTRIRAEVAPSLFHKPVVSERVAKHLPNARIICTVRDPHDRAVSHYFHYRMRGAPKMSLREMADTYTDVIEAGLFSRHVARWEDTFGPDRVHLMSYQLLRDDPDAFCRQLCDALQIDFKPPQSALINSKVNAAKVPRSLLAARVVQSVTTFFRRRNASMLKSMLKRLPIKRWVYSGGADLTEERQSIKKQSASLSDVLSDDWNAFTKRADFPARQTD
ncbi:sulfotransferase domain-containing protein [Roseobacter sp. CCS2]|uniref:sulfotransferase domain-containing protein n=1 Tax=Roseobacter sp. CCS2 TaxID=391593 RepID=UPI0000F4010A|nr:sulfotransferase domain-containing protein [Roseobacter sp. CCS2]EBA13104.1 N-deacetylase/N-sulfotransferase, putative [Roseobacter sp. CCS2]